MIRPRLLWQLYYEGRDGKPRKASTRREHRELDRIVDGRNKDDLFALEWVRILITHFRAGLKEDSTQRTLGALPVLLRNARRIEREIIDGQSYVRDLVTLLVASSSYSAALVKGARLTRERRNIERMIDGKMAWKRERQGQWLALWSEHKLKQKTKRQAALALKKFAPSSVSLRTDPARSRHSADPAQSVTDRRSVTKILNLPKNKCDRSSICHTSQLSLRVLLLVDYAHEEEKTFYENSNAQIRLAVKAERS